MDQDSVRGDGKWREDAWLSSWKSKGGGGVEAVGLTRE